MRIQGRSKVFESFKKVSDLDYLQAFEDLSLSVFENDKKWLNFIVKCISCGLKINLDRVDNFFLTVKEDKNWIADPIFKDNLLYYIVLKNARSLFMNFLHAAFFVFVLK